MAERPRYAGCSCCYEHPLYVLQTMKVLVGLQVMAQYDNTKLLQNYIQC